MNQPWEPDDATDHQDPTGIRYEESRIERAPSEDDGVPEIEGLDTRARSAAAGLQAHVSTHLDASPAAEVVPVGAVARTGVRTRILAVAAVAALLVGFVATQRSGDEGPDRLDADMAVPELQSGLLRPLGPRDGKDSVQLPLTVEPATGLRDGDQVTVRAEGFVPGESVGLVQCAREAGGDTPETRGGVDGCRISDYVNVIADEAGVATGIYAVHRVLTTPLTGTVDCAADAGRCIVAMGAISDYDRSGGHAIEFAPDVEPIAIPTVRVQPSEALTHRQEVHVVADGLTPGDAVYLEVCSSDPVSCWATGEVVRVDSPEGEYESVGLLVDEGGHLEGDVPVWRFLPGDQPGTYVDCVVSRCSLRLSGTTAPPTVPLHFLDDGAPPAAPAVGVDPSSGVAPGDEVTVAGEGFPAGSQVYISLCATPVSAEAAESGFGTCGSEQGSPVLVDEAGAFITRWRIPDLGRYGGGEMCDSTGQCTTVEESGPIVCDGVQDRCELTVEGDWYGGTVDGQVVAPPVFPAAPVPITFRP